MLTTLKLAFCFRLAGQKKNRPRCLEPASQAGRNEDFLTLILCHFEFRDRQFLFAIDFFNDAGGSHFLAAVTKFVQLLAFVIFDEVIVYGFPIHFRLQDRIAGCAFVKGAGGTFSVATDGHFFVIGERIGSIKRQNQRRDASDCCEYFFHGFCLLFRFVVWIAS